MAAATKASTKPAKKPAARAETAPKAAPRRTAAAIAKSPKVATASIEDESMNGATVAADMVDTAPVRPAKKTKKVASAVRKATNAVSRTAAANKAAAAPSSRAASRACWSRTAARSP